MRVRVPANVDMPDRILAGLTFRQLVVLVADGLLVWIVASALHPIVPFPLVVLAVLPLVAVGAVFATQATPGMGLDRLAVLAMSFLLRPKRSVLAPEGIAASNKSGLGVVDIPLESVNDEGVIDLGSEGRTLVASAGTVNLSLRADREQEAIVGAFGRFLNSLEAPMQFVMRAEPVDLTALISDMEVNATSLHPALAARCREHAHFLRALAGNGECLRRQVFVSVLEQGDGESAVTKLAHRVAEAESQLRAAGVRISRIEAEEVRGVVRRSASPDVPSVIGVSHSDDVITGSTG